MDRFDELVSEYLDGSLDAAGRAELESLIDSDPARRDAFVDLVREHRILSVELKPASSEVFTRRMMADLDKDRTRFVRAVMGDLKPPGAGGSRPAPRPRRPLRPEGEGAPGWVLWASLAAGLLVVIAVLLSLSGGEEAPKTERRVAKEKPKPPQIDPSAPQPPREKAPPPPPPAVPVTPKPEVPAPNPLLPPLPTPKPAPEPLTPPKPPSATPEKTTATIAEVAKLESVEGEVTLGEAAAQPGPLTPGFILETKGEKSGAVVRYPDGTRMDLGGATRIQDEPGKAGKVLTLSGVITADVAKQTADKPMLFLTAHAEARVLGTRLRVETIGDSTRLEVTEGRVRLTRLKDKSSVEVAAGHYAVAAPSGTMASRLVRASAGLLALYTFKEGKGAIVHDSARAGPGLDLRIENEAAVKWSARGLLVAAPTIVASPGPAAKIVQACKASNEVTIEAWLRPATLTPAGKDSRIVTLSADMLNQNFMFGQDELKGPTRAFFTRLRTTTTDLTGKPALESPDNTVGLKLSHVVYTRAAAGAATLYGDSVELSRTAGGGTLSTWNDAYRLGLANEFGSDRSWLGEYHLVAVYGRALTADEVKQNFKAGADQ